ncbi:hypothetical protein QEH52_03090 [Coraliomargarita sp. SDUM461003]|uniref:Uncharacterized protein n=1 Tax=Thalassobacterium maritimum TaxID=3041265 RepID=A0ABU1ATN3_9BACT|nr:hypothetical protein [Coraliomargarita sp. SDUM461003]MDQ8206480.1 hypothetical protein [Coraliomargarita sp. SDUM461003]
MLKSIPIKETLITVADGLLHMGSFIVLAAIILLACRLLSRGHVDAKLLTGLWIALLLATVRVLLLNAFAHLLPNSNAHNLELAVIAGLYIAAFILVYKLITIPALGTALSAAAIVLAQLALASYVPQLSQKLMPEGQRFAELTGASNQRTQTLARDAQAFRNRAGSAQQILINTFNSLTGRESGEVKFSTETAPRQKSLDKPRPAAKLDSEAVLQSTSASILTPKPLFPEDYHHAETPDLINEEVAYYMPQAKPVLSESNLATPPANVEASEWPAPTTDEPAAETNYFTADELRPIVTDQSIVQIPTGPDAATWQLAAKAIKIDAWFAAADESGRSTIFIAGNALQDGDTWEYQHQDGHLYRFAFKGIQNNLITLVALERVSASK